VWTLSVADQRNLDGGSLDGWSLDILSGAPPTTNEAGFPARFGVSVPDGPGTSTTSSLLATGLTGKVLSLRLRTDLYHPASAQLDVTLQAPSGRAVTITTDNGLAGVFNGTVWDDKANPNGAVPYVTNDGLVTDHAYSASVLATSLVVEEALSAFMGEDPNGTWTLTLADDTSGIVGVLNGWTLDIVAFQFPTVCATDCNDGNACTTEGCSPTTGCSHDPVTCVDADACTTDSCNPETGCEFTPIPVPGQVSIRHRADKQTIDWSPDPASNGYDVVRGRLNQLPVGPVGGINEICLPTNIASVSDPGLPAATQSRVYVVRGRNGPCLGTYGNQHVNPGPALNGAVRSTVTCP
jgi:subtilisin-like proprotein convertase family protein